MNAAVLIWISITIFGLISVLVLIGNRISRKGKLSGKQKTGGLSPISFLLLLLSAG